MKLFKTWLTATLQNLNETHRQKSKSLSQNLNKQVEGIWTLDHEELWQEDELSTRVLHQAVLLTPEQLLIWAL